MSRRRNPDLLGFDVMTVGIEAGGIAGTAFLNDKLAAPLAKSLLPSVFSASGAMGKAADAVTTAISAWGLSKLIGIFDREAGKTAERGGTVLTIAKVISIPVPGFSVSGALPSGFSIPGLSALTGGAAPAPKQLTAGTSLASAAGGSSSYDAGTNVLTRLGVRTMGF